MTKVTCLNCRNLVRDKSGKLSCAAGRSFVSVAAPKLCFNYSPPEQTVLEEEKEAPQLTLFS